LLLHADAHRIANVLGALRKHHCVRRLVLDPRQRVAVLLAHRLRGHQPIAEFGRQRADRGRDGFLVSARFLFRRQCHFATIPVRSCGRR